jgi:hypothetical protein
LAQAQTTGQQPADRQTAQVAMTMTRAQIDAERQSIVATNLPLTDEQSKAFWPLYREYKTAQAAIGDRMATLILDYAEHYETMTDEKASAMLQDWLKIQQDQTKLKADWAPRFGKILPAKLVTRFYQIENKLDTLVMLDLVDGIPLMK